MAKFSKSDYKNTHQFEPKSRLGPIEEDECVRAIKRTLQLTKITKL